MRINAIGHKALILQLPNQPRQVILIKSLPVHAGVYFYMELWTFFGPRQIFQPLKMRNSNRDIVFDGLG